MPKPVLLDALEMITAPARKLSDVLREYELAPYQLVMDIEGAEAGIVLDDAEALGNCARIVAELHETEHHGRRLGIEDLVTAFCALGFEITDRHGPVVVFTRSERAA